MRFAFLVLLAVCAAGPADALLPCGERQVNDYVTGIQSTPAIAADPTGGFVVTWTSTGSFETDTSDRSIQARIFDAAAQAEGPEFQVNTYTPGRQRRPAVAVDPGTGSFLVVWESTGSPGTDTALQSIQARLFDATGEPFADQMQVNTHTTGAQYDPQVAADGSGGFVVVWESRTSPGTDTDSYSILGRTVTAVGVPAGSDFQVNAYTPSYQVEPSIMSDPAGGFVVLWVSNGSPGTDTDSTSVLGRRLLANGTPSGPEFQVNGYTTSYQDQPNAAPHPGGGFVVVWRSDGSFGNDLDYGSVQARRFDAAGGALGPQFQVNTYTGDYQGYPDIETDGVGGLVVTWDSLGTVGTDTLGFSVQGQRYDGTLAASGGQFQVNTFTPSDQKRPRVVGDGLGGLFVVWQSGVGSGTDPTDGVQVQRLHDGSCTTTSTSTSTSTTNPSTTTSTAVSTSTSSSSTSTSLPTSSTTTTFVPGTTTTTQPGGTTTTSSTTTTTPSSTTTSSTAVTTSTTTTTMAGSSTVTTTSTTTTTTTEPTSTLSARVLRVYEARGKRVGRASMMSRDAAVGTDLSIDDVQRLEGRVRIVSQTASFDAQVPLAPHVWRQGKRGWTYRDDDGTRVMLRPGKRLKITVTGAAFTMGDVEPTPVVVTLRIGGRRLCFEFADGRLSTKRGRFVAKDAVAPASCNEDAQA